MSSNIHSQEFNDHVWVFHEKIMMHKLFLTNMFDKIH